MTSGHTTTRPPSAHHDEEQARDIGAATQLWILTSHRHASLKLTVYPSLPLPVLSSSNELTWKLFLIHPTFFLQITYAPVMLP